MSENRELLRGSIVVVADRRSEFGGKPRPAIVIQRSGTTALSTVTIILLTSTPLDAPLLRVPVPATAETGLQSSSWAMIEHLTTVRRGRIGHPIGNADDATMLEIGRALMVFLGLV